MPTLDDGRVQEATTAVLGAPPFSAPPSPWRLLLDLWHELRDTLILLSDAAPFVYWAVVVLLTGLAVALLVHLGLMFRQAYVALGRAPRFEGPHFESDPLPSLAAARRALGIGDHRAAVKHAYDASMAALARSTEVSRTGRTPRAFLASLGTRVSPALQAQMHELLGLHERSCYAGAVTTRADADRAIERACTVVDEGAVT